MKRLKDLPVILCIICFVIGMFSGCGNTRVTNEEFLEDLSKGLIARWDMSDEIPRKETDSNLEEIARINECILEEWKVIKSYQDKEFSDTEFGELAADYVAYMENAKDAYELKEDYFSYLAEMYKGVGGATKILTVFAEKYDLYNYMDRDYWSSLEGVTGVCKQIPIEEITNNDWEGVYEASFKFGDTYQFHISDIDKKTKKCNVKLNMNNTEILGSNGMILDNTRLYFELQGKDDSQPVKFTINYQKASETPYYLKRIDEEYEPDDEMISELTLDYSIADETVEMTRMSDKEFAEKMKEEYIFADSDKRYLSEDEVRSVEADEMVIGRNEIFARHGYIFEDETLRQHFEDTSWYEGTTEGDEFDSDAVFNDFEKKNVELIKRVEDEINGPSGEELAEQEIVNEAYNFLVGHSFHLQDSQPLMIFESHDTIRYRWGGNIEDDYFNYSISARYEVYKDDLEEWLTFLTIDGEEYYLRTFTNGTFNIASTSGYGDLDGWYELYD